MPLAQADWSSFGPQLDPGLTFQQITTMRYNCLWQKAIVCPNRMLDTKNHNVDCTLCDGTGFLYDEGCEQKVLVTGVSLRQQYMSQGRFDAGMAMLTALPTVKLSWWDKVTFNETTVRYTEAVQRGVGATDKLKYKIIDEMLPDKSGNLDPGVLALATADGAFLLYGTDFNVVNGEVSWVNPPSVGSFYSLTYLIRPAYIVIDVNHHARTLPTGRSTGKEKTVAFPIQAVGKLDFLIGDESRVPA